MEKERGFKGVWIPREIWLSKELTLREKVMIVEIDSLETEDNGCYASNSYFSEFFNISNSTVSEIIKSLVDKGWITSEIIKEGKQIVERRLRIKRPPFPYIGYSENGIGGIRKSEEGYSENTKENNIYINNIKNIYTSNEPERFDNREDVLAHDFEIIYAEYPRKEGKNNAFKAYKAWKAGKKVLGKTVRLSNEEMYNAVLRYKEECMQSNREKKYIKQADTFFRNINEYVEGCE